MPLSYQNKETQNKSDSWNDIGYVKLAVCVPEVKIADPYENALRIGKMLLDPSLEGASVVLFPELSITGYTCADLFTQNLLLDSAEKSLAHILEISQRCPASMIVVGMPLRHRGRLYNSAVVISAGSLMGAVPKQHLPNYAEFYEKRWFESGKEIIGEEILVGGRKIPFGVDLLFKKDGVIYGIEICEDMWVPQPPATSLCLAGADVILNLSASDENIGKHDYLLQLISHQSAACRCAYVYASAGWGESSTDLAFSGNAMIASDGVMLAEGRRFATEPEIVTALADIERLRTERRKYNSYYDAIGCQNSIREIMIDSVGSKSEIPATNVDAASLGITPLPFVPDSSSRLWSHCEEITSIQAWGLMQRLSATGCRDAVIGISGGLDSTLALLVTVKAFDNLHIPRENIHAVTMPGFGTTGRTHGNAWQLMEALGVNRMEICIDEAVRLHFSQIGHDEGVHDATYENSQARERTQILMDLANKTGGMVIGTGDLSELALGWCTYNGDQMSMYGVNASVPKTLVRHLVAWHAENGGENVRNILLDIIDTPISPELIPAEDDGSIKQKTEDLVGPYELHDFYLYHTLRNGFSPKKIFLLACVAFKEKYDENTVARWLRIFYSRFFSQQFKRSAMPDGPKVGSVCLSPRGDWRMPSDASRAMWIREIDEIMSHVK